jgi:hypothetical protein
MSDDQRILVRQAGSAGSWSSPEISTYDNESHLQALLVGDPNRVPGVTHEASAVAELSTSGGPIDVAIVESDGGLTVVECKLASNSERRRMVVGQVIDYASAIWMDGEEAFFRAWEARGGADLFEVLTTEALAALKRNIVEARINLCLAVDSIDDDLRRLVEYLNRVTTDHIRVTALQLGYARHGDLEILIPLTFGGEIAAAKARASEGGKSRWTRESFLEAIASEADRRLAEEYFDRLVAIGERRGDHPEVWYGTRPDGGVYLHPYGLKYAPIQLWVNRAGRLMLYGTWKIWGVIAGHDGFAGLARLLGQDHRNGYRGVAADSLDIDAVWAESLECAIAINQPAGEVLNAQAGSDKQAAGP